MAALAGQRAREVCWIEFVHGDDMLGTPGFISATAALAFSSALVCAQGFAANTREAQSVVVAQAAAPEPAPTPHPAAAAVQSECDRLAASPVPLAPPAVGAAKTPADWAHA